MKARKCKSVTTLQQWSIKHSFPNHRNPMDMLVQTYNTFFGNKIYYFRLSYLNSKFGKDILPFKNLCYFWILLPYRLCRLFSRASEHRSRTTSSQSKPKVYQNIQIVPSAKLLGIRKDDRLDFNEHISSICKSAANQLNALVKLKTFLGSNDRKVLANSFGFIQLQLLSASLVLF